MADTKVHELIRARWSPRAVSSKPVEREKLLAILEAARWAPSSYNEQPWRFVVATSEDSEGLKVAQSVLVKGNAWAREAPVLICVVAKMTFSHNDKPNAHAWHDTGAASENMFLEAFHQGLVMHQMAGFYADKAREVFQIPDGFEPVAMVAVGYYDGPQNAERVRKPLEEIVFRNRFGQALQ